MIEVVGLDLGNGAPIVYTQRAYTHPLVADPNASIAQNTARLIVKNHGRPLLLIHVYLRLDKAALAGTVPEYHVLQFAFATLVANGAVQRMIRQQEFERTLARLPHDR